VPLRLHVKSGPNFSAEISNAMQTHIDDLVLGMQDENKTSGVRETLGTYALSELVSEMTRLEAELETVNLFYNAADGKVKGNAVDSTTFIHTLSADLFQMTQLYLSQGISDNMNRFFPHFLSLVIWANHMINNSNSIQHAHDDSGGKDLTSAHLARITMEYAAFFTHETLTSSRGMVIGYALADAKAQTIVDIFLPGQTNIF